MTIDARRFSQVLRALAQVPAQAAAKSARDLNREIQRNFDRGVDPYGKPWKKLARSTKRRGRSDPPLTHTGRGRRSVKIMPMAGAGLRLVIGVLYMIYHQFGGMSHLKGPSGTSVDRKKNPNFGRDKDRGGKRNNPPKRSFAPFEKIPRVWGEIVIGNIEALAKKAFGRG